MADLRDALRSLRAAPIVSSMAVLSLALGIGANTAIFSLVNALMLRSLPVKEPQQLVQVLATADRQSWTNPLWEEIRSRERQLFDGAFAYVITRFNLARGGEAQNVNGLYASGGYFEVLGVPAILGRTFTRENDIRRGQGIDARQVAVIGYGFWQRRYGGAADVLGKTIELDRVPFTIIGVTGPAFTGVDQGLTYDVAIPLAVGIRMALGAGPASAVRLVLLQVAVLVGLGLLSGAALAWWAGRLLASTTLLFGLQPRDPATFTAAILLLSVIGAAAGYLPARRAARIDPARVLREG